MKEINKILKSRTGQTLTVTTLLVVLIFLPTALNSNRLTTVAKATSKADLEIEQLKESYQRLNDDLYEVKLSRDRLANRVEELENQIEKLKAEKQEEKKEVSKGTLHTITCYDLSESSNGTWIGHKHYGLTANGFDLRGKTWDMARTVAVDPKLYPLGTKLRLTFTNDKYAKYNGVYTARDTGGAIKGKKLDLFLGDFGTRKTHPSVWEFGKTQAYVEVVKD